MTNKPAEFLDGHTNPFCQHFEQLPPSVPVFPLAGTIVLPGGLLPLNIFEPRYINMVQDAMRSDQLIGMIQPIDNTSKPTLHSIGCVARIVRYEETPDKRFSITLAGLCRFKVAQELEGVRGYRIVAPDWSSYKCDYDKAPKPNKADVERLVSLLKAYCKKININVDWTVTEALSGEEIINNSAIYLPLDKTEKQFLLEAQTLNERLSILTALLEERITTIRDKALNPGILIGRDQDTL